MTLPKSTIKKIAPLLFLLLAGCLVVFYQYLSIPKNTTFDEIEFAKLALQLGKQPYAPYSQLATGHATLYFYIILLSFKLFGVSLFALRLPAAVFGILNPLIFYLIMKKIFNPSCHPELVLGSSINTKMLKPVQHDNFFLKYQPFILSLIFITLRWYFNFARFGFEVTFLLFLELMSLYFMFKYTDVILNLVQDLKKMPKQVRHDKIWLVFSGIFAGLAYNSYQPGRIFVLIPLFLLLVKGFVIPALRIGGGIQAKITSLMYFLIPFFILILPLIIYLNIHKDTRFYQQFYPDNHEMTLDEKGQFFMRNLSSTAGIFLVNGDVNGRHNYPNKAALNPMLGVLFLAGLLIAIKKIKERNNQLFLLWFFLSLAPTLVTYPWENPNMLRTFTVIPSVVYFVGLAIKKLSDVSILQKPALKNVFIIMIFMLISVSSLYELRTYFVHQAQVFKEAFETERDLIYYLNPSDVPKK
ncbi:glycosyltransferase family 39 protein [Candidatus Roizmanbacteria bacterium]|nr:glycosyltransferase family 39 protein [Candidatus Roizmanbacteria bacterium]